MSWKHKEPLGEDAADDPVPVPVNLLVNSSYEAGEAPFRNIFGHPVTNLLENSIFIRNPSPAKSNHCQGSSIINASQQGPSTDIDSAGLENGNTKHSPSRSNSPCPSLDKQALCPTTGQALQPSKRKPSYKSLKDRQPASISLGLVCSSKVSKAAGKKKPGPQQQPNILQKISSSSLLLPSGIDIAETQPSLAPVNLCKSLQIQLSIPSIAKNSKYITRSKSKQNITNNITAKSSAKPQGISKRQPAKTTQGQGKARKE